MRFLLVGPEICAPWTEGRKNFVAQLAEGLLDEDEVRLLTAIPRGHGGPLPIAAEVVECRGKASMLWTLLRRLDANLRGFSPDLVCHFPYGTFRRHYGIVNRAFMRVFDRACTRRGHRCLTVMYSIDEHADPRRLAGLVSNLALGRRDDWRGWTVDPGIASPGPPGRGDRSDERKLLFMAGMWEPTRARVEHVLDVRGLGVLLRAGERLAAAGATLEVACPLLADAECADYVRRHPCNRWPARSMTLSATVDKHRAFASAALFVFPYQHDIEVFTPTSVIEAMFCGTPVVLSDTPLLRGLAAGGRTAYAFRHDDPDDLARVVVAALDDRSGRRRVAAAARRYAEEYWSLARPVSQLRAIARQIARR